MTFTRVANSRLRYVPPDFRRFRRTPVERALTFAEHVSAAVIHIYLPDLDGVEVCRILRSRPETAQLPILHVAGRAQESLDDAAASSADGFMSTPVEHSSLKDTVIQLLAKKT